MFRLAGYEIRAKEQAFTLESENLELTEYSKEPGSKGVGQYFTFKLNLDTNSIKKQCSKLIGENSENTYELILIDLCGNILKKPFYF